MKTIIINIKFLGQRSFILRCKSGLLEGTVTDASSNYTWRFSIMSAQAAGSRLSFRLKAFSFFERFALCRYGIGDRPGGVGESEVELDVAINGLPRGS